MRTPGVRLIVRRLFVLCLLCANPWTGFGVTSVGYTLISRSPISEMGKPTLAINLTVKRFNDLCTVIVECTYGSGGGKCLAIVGWTLCGQKKNSLNWSLFGNTSRDARSQFCNMRLPRFRHPMLQKCLLSTTRGFAEARPESVST